MTRLRRNRYDSKRDKQLALPVTLLEAIKLEAFFKHGKFTGYIVDGATIRNEIDVDFALGGNHARYAYVPKNEIWVEATGDEEDMASTAFHEVMECQMMSNGYTYDEAHDAASRIEGEVRG